MFGLVCQVKCNAFNLSFRVVTIPKSYMKAFKWNGSLRKQKQRGLQRIWLVNGITVHSAGCLLIVKSVLNPKLYRKSPESDYVITTKLEACFNILHTLPST